MNLFRKVSSKIGREFGRRRARKKIRAWAAGKRLPALSSEGAILFFTPEGGVKPHFAAQCVVARTLKEMGHKVLFVRCFKTFDWCPVYEAGQLDYPLEAKERENQCFHCARLAIGMLEEYGLESISLNALCTPDILARVDRAMSACPKDLNDFSFDGIPFGKITIFDLSLATKQYDYSRVDEATRRLWLRYIRNALLSYLLTEEICRQHSISRLLIFNDYSLLLSARLAAQKRGVGSISMTQAGIVDRRRYVFCHSDRTSSGYLASGYWPRWRELSLTEQELREITDDLLLPFRGKQWHIYATPKSLEVDSLYSRLGLERSKKLLVAYTSSLDEITCGRMGMMAMNKVPPAPKQPFTDQIEWLRAMVTYVRDNDDLQLVVRVHPREGASKDGKRAASPHLAQLKQNFTGTFERVRFFWPEDAVSSYDLAEMADVALVSWSSMGMELARLGIPVISSTMGIGTAPQDDFMAWGETPQQFFRELERLLSAPVSLQPVIHAYRCFHLLNFAISLNFGDVVPSYDFVDLPPYKFPGAADALEEIVIGGREILDVNFERRKAAQHSESALEERLAIKRQMRRLIHYLYTAEENCADHKLLLVRSSMTPQDLFARFQRKTISFGLRVLLVNDQTSHYIRADGTTSKFSPLAVRLALLAAQFRYSDAGAPPRDQPSEGKYLNSEEELAACLAME